MIVRKRMGRPPEPIPHEKAEAICKWISEGNTLMSWCELNRVPVRTVHDWMSRDADFAANYARARIDMGDAIAARMRDLAAQPSDHPDDVQHRRLQIDTDKWLLARWYPQRYGDRVGLEHSGGITLNVITGVPDA